MADDDLLPITEVAKRLSVIVEPVRRDIKQKKIAAVRLTNTNLRVRTSELERFIRERETNGGAEPDKG